MCVVVVDPSRERSAQLSRAAPCREPETCFFQRAHQARWLGMALRIVVAGQSLLNPQCMARLPKGERGRLTPVVTHQGETLPPRAIRALPVDSQIHRRHPMLGWAGRADVVPDNLLGLPIQHHHDLNPAAIPHQELGHRDAPPFMGLGGSGFTPRRRPLGLELPVGRDHEVVLPHQAQAPRLVHRPRLHEAPIGPDAAVAPARGLGFARLNPVEPAFMALGDQARAGPTHPRPSSLFGHSKVSSPTRVFTRAFSRAKRASCRAS